jgi:high-affinity iron transporter
MLNSAIIVFREFFEISLIISIVIFAVKDIKSYKKYVISGILVGIITSILSAFAFFKLQSNFSEQSQEFFNIGILSLVILLIFYTVIWLQYHSKQHFEKIKNTSKQIIDGSKPLYAISIIIASSMIREGMEIVLFLAGIITSGTPVYEVGIGFIIGSMAGILSGLLMYYGLVKVPQRIIFTLTKWLLIFIAASMSSEIANMLQSANIINVFYEQLWNSEWLLSENSILGQILSTLIGYNSNPTILQFLFYAVTIILIFVVQKIIDKKQKIIQQKKI